MKRIFLLFLLSCGLISAQEVVKNGPRPLSGRGGRVLELKREFLIPSDGEGYYFNLPGELRLGGDRSFFIRDIRSSQRCSLLRFSSGGGFIRDYIRPGEGPGEIKSYFDYALTETGILLYDVLKRKLIRLDREGGLFEEHRLETSADLRMIGAVGGVLYFYKSEYPVERKTSSFYDIQVHVVRMSLDGSEKKPLCTLTYRHFFISLGKGGGGMAWDPFLCALGPDGPLVVCRTREYAVEILDPETGETRVRFSRPYSRVPHEEKEYERDFRKRHDAPKIRFECDIRSLLIADGRIWVETSTNAEVRGPLIDIFDMEGRFLDSFYLGTPGRLLAVAGESLFVAGMDSEELPVVAKYRIMDPQD